MELSSQTSNQEASLQVIPDQQDHVTVRDTETQQSPSKSSQGELHTTRKEDAVPLVEKDSPELAKMLVPVGVVYLDWCQGEG